ncbi:MAG: HAD family hydrolase [Eubacteriales bacterium]|nr:HAD family hydrolase [Eubacteriales bacterium]
MNKKLIFLDIDGTLTEPGKNIPPESAVEAVEMARRAGHKVFLCTGRNYGMLKPLLKYGFDGLIASSGGYIEVEKKVIYDHPMTKEQEQRAMDVLAQNQIFCTIECRDGSYTDERLKDFLRDNQDKSENSELLRWREQIEQSLGIRPMSEYKGQPLYKIVMMALSRESLENAKKILGKDFAFCIQETKGHTIHNGELICTDYDKGQAVERVCSYLGYTVKDTIGFGDSMNDLEMMEMVGISVCMQNGSNALKNIADYVCPPYYENGIYEAFQRYQLLI